MRRLLSEPDLRKKQFEQVEEVEQVEDNEHRGKKMENKMGL